MKILFRKIRPVGAARVASRQNPRTTLILGLVLAALSLGNAAQAKTRSFPIPTPNSQPISITMGADGNFWFTEANSSRVARITPQGVITEFVTPTFSFPFDITPGPDGNIWFSEGSTGQIAFITPAGQITEIVFSSFDNSSGIVTGPDGNIWFTDLTGNNIWRYNLTTRVLNKFPVPTPNSFPNDIAVGADGNLWFTEQTGGNIGRITTTGVITEFGNGGLASPRSITDGPDGNVWFTLSNPQIGKITPAGVVTFFATPTNAEDIARGPGNTLLFTEFGFNKIASITTSGVVTESQEFRNSEPTGITAGVGHTAWFLGFGNNKVYTTNLPR
ncbi:MAG: Virginiamycin B lyase [Chthoniobacterales bacterium]|nr:Virginiamycin B lyase [Chthoniobacterales bacterium]